MLRLLVVGLGNPGDEYVLSRHNTGFQILDAFALKYGFEFESARYGLIAKKRIKSKVLFFLKPSTYMNLSGRAVKYWLRYLDLPPENLVVCVDDIALPLGKIRIRFKGGNGGHNGLLNIIEELGTENFIRIRIGIGNDFGKGHQVNFVLGKWTPEELEILNQKKDVVIDAVHTILFEGIDKAMTVFNKD